MTMMINEHQATPVTAEQGVVPKKTPEPGHRSAETDEKTDNAEDVDNVEEREPRRASPSPVPKKGPEDDKSLDPVTKLILAKKITEFSAEHGRDPSKDEIEQMFEETIRMLGEAPMEDAEDAEDIAGAALPVELTDAPVAEDVPFESPAVDIPMPDSAEHLKKRKLDVSAEDHEAVKKPKTNEAAHTSPTPIQQPASEADAGEEPEAVSAKPEPSSSIADTMGEEDEKNPAEDEKNPEEIDSEIAVPEATAVDSEEKVSVLPEKAELSPPKNEEQPAAQEEPTTIEHVVNGTEMAVDDAAEQSGRLKKRKRDVSTEDVEAVKKLKTNMAVAEKM